MSGLLRLATVAGLLSTLSLLPGCNQPEAPPAAPKSPVRQIDTAGLPALGEYAPPLDAGRIEIAGPEGWQLAPRVKDYVVCFRGSTDDQYPLILVKAEDASTEPLTRETAVAFAKSLAADGTAQPAAVGEQVGALQLKRSKAPGSIDQIVERLLFTTVYGKRTYIVELRVRQGQLQEYQDMLFAVVGSMREIDESSTEPADDATPADTKQDKKSDGAEEEAAKENE